MKLITTTIGSYPRPRWFREYLKKVEGLQKEGEETEIDKEIYKKAVAEVIENQNKAKIELLTDGQLIWQDFLAYLATKISGFEMNGLTRYFDNNVYYRMPIVKEKVNRSKPIILEEFSIAREIEKEKNIKAVISCFTLAKLSINKFYKNEEEFILDLAKIMHEEAKELAKKTKYIQLSEPSLLYASKEELEIAKQAVEIITSNVDAKFFLVTYFESAEKIFPEVLDFKVDVIGLDFVEGYDKNLSLLKEYGIDKALQIGILDGRNTKMENVEEVKSKLKEILDVASPKEVYVSPNTGLEFLPWIKAYEKLEVLGKVVE